VVECVGLLTAWAFPAPVALFKAFAAFFLFLAAIGVYAQRTIILKK
jgi:hypothetical protein